MSQVWNKPLSVHGVIALVAGFAAFAMVVVEMLRWMFGYGLNMSGAVLAGSAVIALIMLGPVSRTKFWKK